MGTRLRTVILSNVPIEDGNSLWVDTTNNEIKYFNNGVWTPIETALVFGIADTNTVTIDSNSVADNDYAKFTANGVEGRSYSEVLSDIGAQANGGSISTTFIASQITANSLYLKTTGWNAGTFVANGATPVDISRIATSINDVIIISLNTIGGTVGAQPVVTSVTADTGFSVTATAGDTSTYNYVVIQKGA